MHNTIFLCRSQRCYLFLWLACSVCLPSLWEFLESFESLGFGDNPQSKGIHRPETLPSKSTITITLLLSPYLSSCKRIHSYKKICSSHHTQPLPSTADPMTAMTTSSQVLSNERQTPPIFQELGRLYAPLISERCSSTHRASCKRRRTPHISFWLSQQSRHSR